MKIIMLDIDGVLSFDGKTLIQYAINNLRTILDLNPDVNIVLSSSWRISSSWRQDLIDATIDGNLSWIDRIISTTPDLVVQTDSGLYISKTRDDEILAWLDDNKDLDIIDYVIIDDMWLNNPKLVQCKSRVGLDNRIMMQVLYKLNGVQ